MTFLISSRRARSADDPIFALNFEAKARAQAGEAVVNATVGALLDDEGKLAVLGAVAYALREIPQEVVSGYAPIVGPAAFLRAVIDDLLGGRDAASWATAVATPGGTGALRHAIANFLEPGQALLTTSFHWSPYQTLALEADREIRTFPMFDAEGRFDTQALERSLGALVDEQGRALLLLNSPCHNPTGYSFDDREWDEVASVVRSVSARGPVVLVLDVAYARYGAVDLASAIDRVADLGPGARTCFAWSASKAFTAYGLRVGALVVLEPDAAERKRVEAALSFGCRGVWSNCNAGGMAAITRVLSEPDLRVRVDRERAGLKALLDKRVARWNEVAGAAGLRYPRYAGGFFTTVFCDDPNGAAARLKEEGMFVVPQPGALRVALASVPERDIPRLVEGITRHAVKR